LFCARFTNDFSDKGLKTTMMFIPFDFQTIFLHNTDIMKKQSLILITLVCFVFAAAASQADTIVIAHRGYSGIAPENTLAAVRKAIELDPQPTYIEIDLHRSADGVLVVSHADNTKRATGRDFMIREKPFAFLRTLDAGYKKNFGDAYKGEKIPRLEEVLDAVKGTPIGIMIELKQLLLEDDVVALLRKRNEMKKHVIASFDELSIFRAKKLEPAVRTLYLAGTIDPTRLWRAKDVKADIFAVSYKDCKPELIPLAHKAGYPVWVWTVDKSEDIETWKNVGVDGIISNQTKLALKITTP